MARYDDDDDDDDRDDDAVSERPIKKKKKRGDPSEGGFVGFLLFRKFVGDWIIIIVYWILVAFMILGGLAYMVFGVIAAMNIQGGGGKALAIAIGVGVGLLVMILYPVLLRIYVEIVILLYRIEGHLREIRDNTR
jgi:hypothetical protein